MEKRNSVINSRDKAKEFQIFAEEHAKSKTFWEENKQYLTTHTFDKKDLEALFDVEEIQRRHDASIRRDAEALGEARGISIGEARGISIGEARGEEKGKLKICYDLYRDGDMSSEKAATKLNFASPEEFLQACRDAGWQVD